jgi:hypothetical protein
MAAENLKEIQTSDEAQVEHISDSEKGAQKPDRLQESEQEYVVTYKTWTVVWILSFSYGISFWIIPALGACQSQVATQLGDVTAQAFFLSVYTLTITIAFMICGGMLSSFPARF